MRLSKAEIRALREALAGLPVERVFLFGSRTDDARRGGDIDILLHTRGRRSAWRIRSPAALPMRWMRNWT